MLDIIVHVPNLIAFRLEAADNARNGVLGFLLNEAGGVIYNVYKVSVGYSGNQSVTLVRLTSQAELSVFNNMASCVRLGTCVNKEYIFDSEADKLTYENTHGDLKVEYVDENGDTQYYFKPYMIGVIA